MAYGYTAVVGKYGTSPAAYPVSPFQADQMADGRAQMAGMQVRLLQSFAQLQSRKARRMVGSPEMGSDDR